MNNLTKSTIQKTGKGTPDDKDSIAQNLEDVLLPDESDTTERENFLRLFRKLREDTLELRSSLTSLVLQTEEMDSFSDRHKECILRICDVINKKHKELLYSEKLMKEVILQLESDNDPVG